MQDFSRRQDDRISEQYLMPFGGVEPQVVLDAQHFAALRRASAKLETLNSGRGFVPAGPSYALVREYLIGAAIVGGLNAPIFALCLYFAEYGASVFFGVILLIVLARLAHYLHGTTPHSPEAAMQTFYALLARGQYNDAFERVVRCDHDDFPMRPNDIPTLGNPGPAMHLDARAFESYWISLLHVQPAPWLEIRTHGYEVKELSEGLFGVEFNIELIIRNRQWLWLTALGILPGYLLAIILSYMTSTRVRGRLHKLVYCMDGEFQLFNGEFQGAEEFDLSWLMPQRHSG